MNVPLVVAGCRGILGAASLGIAGEVRVLRRLSLDGLPPTTFGGPRTTKLMIHVTWHLTTIAFLTVAISLLLAGSVLHGDAARAIGLVAASASTGFAAIAVGLTGAYTRSLRSLVRHPGPALLTATAALAWWGVL